MRYSVAILVAMLASSASTAHALQQTAHRTISRDACSAAGLPSDFCARVGIEAYNVDSYEWNDATAHAQIAVGQSTCDAANRATQRLASLGVDIRVSLGWLAASPSSAHAGRVAVQLGRALHTVQDNCAHHGLPNDQHAWLSLRDTCSGTRVSPDLTPDALACARNETTAVMSAFVDAVFEAGVQPELLDDTDDGWSHWPARADVCAFLREATSWDGGDRRWDNGIVMPWFRDELIYAMTTGDDPHDDICGGDANALAVSNPRAHADVSQPPPWCFKLSTYCVGKADGADEPPPWDESATDGASEPQAGCAVGAASGNGTLGALLLGGAIVSLWRRRPRRGPGRQVLDRPPDSFVQIEVADPSRQTRG